MKIPFVSTEDAKFLYLEGRIKKFVLLMPDEADKKFVLEKFQPMLNDVTVIGLNKT